MTAEAKQFLKGCRSSSTLSFPIPCSFLSYFPSTLYSQNTPSSPPSCCGAGTAADTEKTTELLSSNLTIFSLNSGRNPRVVMAVNILQEMLYRFV